MVKGLVRNRERERKRERKGRKGGIYKYTCIDGKRGRESSKKNKIQIITDINNEIVTESYDAIKHIRIECRMAYFNININTKYPTRRKSKN